MMGRVRFAQKSDKSAQIIQIFFLNDINKNRDGIHGQSPLKGILSEHPEQALMSIKNSFQTTALTWILSLGKKFKLSEFEEKTALSA